MSWAKLSFKRIRGVQDVFDPDYFYPRGLKVSQKESNNYYTELSNASSIKGPPRSLLDGGWKEVILAKLQDLSAG